MKYRLTVTLDIEDSNTYALSDDGWAVGAPTGKLDAGTVANHVADAVHHWGGQYAPGDPLFPRNIRSVRVQTNTGHDFISKRDDE